MDEHFEIDSHDWQKNVINTAHRIHSVEAHIAHVEGTSENLSYRRQPENPPLLINHYPVQSFEFFNQNKKIRGSANSYYSINYKSMDWFNACDINDVVDTRLSLQNKLNNIAQGLSNFTKFKVQSVSNVTAYAYVANNESRNNESRNSTASIEETKPYGNAARWIMFFKTYIFVNYPK